jgi:predicted nucleic acid-binding protein
MSRRVHLDANVILRFLRNDDPRQSPQAAELFRRAQTGRLELIVSAVTVMEVFYVLHRSYGLPRDETARILRALLTSDAVGCDDREVVLDALRRVTANKISFGDACVAAAAVRVGAEIATFDQGMASFQDARFYPLDPPGTGSTKSGS